MTLKLEDIINGIDHLDAQWANRIVALANLLSEKDQLQSKPTEWLLIIAVDSDLLDAIPSTLANSLVVDIFNFYRSDLAKSKLVLRDLCLSQGYDLNRELATRCAT
jgi:hypothetical protein